MAKTFCRTARCFTLLDALYLRILNGMTNKELADATGFTAVQVCRDMDLLNEIGQVEKTSDGRWHIHSRAIGKAVAYQNQMAEYARKGDDYQTRVNAYAARLKNT